MAVCSGGSGYGGGVDFQMSVKRKHRLQHLSMNHRTHVCCRG